MTAKYVPQLGDLIWIDFDPQVGREQSGHRPALVLTPARYNRLTELCALCPITSRVRGYPFEYVLPAGLPVHGAVLCDQVKSMSWVGRGARTVGRVGDDVLDQVRGRIASLLSIAVD